MSYQSYTLPPATTGAASSHQYEPRCAPPPTHPGINHPPTHPGMNTPTWDQQMSCSPQMNAQMNASYTHPRVYQPVPYAGPSAPAVGAQPQLHQPQLQPQLVYVPRKPPMTSGKAQAVAPVTTNSPFREATVARVLLRNCGPDSIPFPQLYYNQQLLDNGKSAAAGVPPQGTWCPNTMTPTHARPPTPRQPSKASCAPAPQMVYHVVPGGMMVMSTPSPSPVTAQPEFKNTGEPSGARSPEAWADRSNSGASTESNVSHVTNETSDDPMAVPPATSPSNESTNPVSMSPEKDGVTSMTVSPTYEAQTVSPTYEDQCDKKTSMVTESTAKSPSPRKTVVEPPQPLDPPPYEGPVSSPPSDMVPTYENEAPPLLIPAPLATYRTPTSNLEVYAPQDMKPPEDPENMMLDPSTYSPVSPATTTPAIASTVTSEGGRTTPGSTYKHSDPSPSVREKRSTNTLKGTSPKCDSTSEALPKTLDVPCDPVPVVKIAEEAPAGGEKSTKRTRTANDEHLAHILAPLLQPPKEEPWIVKRTRKRRKPKSADSMKPVEFESEESRGSSMTSSKPNSPKKLSGPEAEARRALRTARNQRKRRRKKKKRSKEQKEASASPEPTEKDTLVATEKTAEGRESACAWLQSVVYRLLGISPGKSLSHGKQD